MIDDSQLPELDGFRVAEEGLPLRNDPHFEKLVVSGDGDQSSIHRWYRLKESFSPRLLGEMIERLYPRRRTSLKILDPFAGVGTTLLAAQELARKGADIEAVGIERNPFIAFAARTKTHWRDISPESFRNESRLVFQRMREWESRLPELTSIQTGRCISHSKTRQILALREAIGTVPNAAERAALLLGLASAIESLSKTRKDGRALRLVTRRPAQIRTAVTARWEQIYADCVSAQKTFENCRNQPLLLEGDGRDPGRLGIEASSVDLVFTSPPYPNNIDYSEVYKLELWLLGFVQDKIDFLRLRRQTFRSHPTCLHAELDDDLAAKIAAGGLSRTIAPLLERVSGDRMRSRVFSGYFSDLWATLKNARTCLKRGGYAVFTVGNSLHGSSDSAYLVPTDLVLAQMGESLGFTLCETIIARNLKRRIVGNHFLRESIIVLRKK